MLGKKFFFDYMHVKLTLFSNSKHQDIIDWN